MARLDSGSGFCLSPSQPETPEERNARIEAEWQAEITTLSKDAESIARETKSLATTVEEINSQCDKLQSELSSLNDDLTLLKVFFLKKKELSFFFLTSSELADRPHVMGCVHSRRKTVTLG